MQTLAEMEAYVRTLLGAACRAGDLKAAGACVQDLAAVKRCQAILTRMTDKAVP